MAVTNQIDEATTTTAAAMTQTTIDAGSPLYVHPSDSSGSSLVPLPFDGIGYRSWRKSVLRALSVKNKIGFITGDTEKPIVNSPLFRQWERCDDMVTSWILNSLSKDIADSVKYVNDSVELWKELQDRYDQTNGAKLYQIKKEINDLSQGVLDITGYYTKMKKLWEELNTLSVKAHCSCICTCRANESMHKVEQDKRLIQFLMGLNEVYTVVRGSILMMNPLPNMAQAFALLIQEEKQREFRPMNQLNIDSTTLNANLGGKNFKTNYSTGTGNQAANNRARPFCDYCKRQGNIGEGSAICRYFLPTAGPFTEEASGDLPFRERLEPRTSPHVFVGYPFGTKGYKVLSLATKKIHISRDVSFHESIFPFTLNSTTSDIPSVFPNTPFFESPPDHTDIHLSHNISNNVNNQENTNPLSSGTPPIASSPVSSVHESQIPVEQLQDVISSQQSLTGPLGFRKSNREHKLPSHLNDYVYKIPNLKCTTNFSLHAMFSHNNHIMSDALHPDSQHIVENICNDREPTSYEEAAIYPAWQNAVPQEFEALYANRTWDLVPLPEGKHAIGCRWVYTVKHRADGSVKRYKAKLVVKGYTQQTGVDYIETFSLMVKMTTVRSLIAITTKKKWQISQLDVNNAFLHRDLHEEASRQWYDKLTEVLYSRGYAHSMHDYSLFYRKQNSSIVFIAVYVDDVLLIGTDSEEIDQLKAFLHDKFRIKDLGQLHYFLGLEILYKLDGIIISQRKFVLDLLKDYVCLHCPSLTSPLDSTTKSKAKEGAPLSDPTFYRKLIGKLNFLTNTRLDIAYGVQHLTCPDSKRSVSEYIVFMGGSPISWKSKKQETISLSSAEAEYRALRKVVGELVWLSRLLEELTVSVNLPIPVHCDSLSALHIARNHVFHERTKHIEVDCHFVRIKLHERLISLHHIGTGQQLADVLTKALTGIKHYSVLSKLGVISSHPT
ncbi:uncharacterized protein LOC142162398 [Nicotiana tabacum]|uniref:Uncharacterized protein LOC142162398 n=1 Tax=Nicotiana tabacum TaxID=4097 RepID=A0AC58RQ30_TOBAC